MAETVLSGMQQLLSCMGMAMLAVERPVISGIGPEHLRGPRRQRPGRVRHASVRPSGQERGGRCFASSLIVAVTT